jgi:hypothetical protein
VKLSKLDAALGAASRGFRVFPVCRDSKVPWSKGWQDAATTDAAAIRQWWTENSQWNIGIATGKGLLVVDVDVKDGKPGAESLAMLEMMGLPETLRVRTPTGGLHIYLQTDRQRSGHAGNIKDLPGLDTRGDGNLVLWAGSYIGRDAYALEADLPIAAGPKWLLDAVEETVKAIPRAEEPMVDLDLRHNLERATEYLQLRAPDAIQGAGGDTSTYSVAAELRALGVSETVALELMLEHWNEQKASPPWLPDELARKVANAFRHGQGAPGGKTAAGEFGAIDIGDIGSPPAAVAEMIRGAAERGRASAVAASRRRVLSYAEMCNMPAPEWLVDGVIQKRSAALMFGRSNSFKSFLAVDIALAVATGRDWHEQAVDRGRAMIVATEGANGVGRLRVPGWLNYYCVDPADRSGVFLLPSEISLDDSRDVDWLISEMKRVGPLSLLVLDIFGGTMAGTEVEDTTARAWVRAVQRIMAETGAAVLTVAHTGWQDDSRARMHTHFWGSFDSRMKVDGDRDALTTCLTIERHKDADSSGAWGFNLLPSHNTLVPVFDESVRSRKEARYTPAQSIAMKALATATESHGEKKSGEGWPRCPVVAEKVWQTECVRMGITKSENAAAARMAFARARQALESRQAIAGKEGYYWGAFEA